MKIWKYGNIINKVNILIFRVSNYNLLPFHFHIFPYFLNNIEYKKISLSLKMRNFHWKIQKFKNPFFIILISFSINFKQFFFFVFHTFFYDFTPFFRTFFNFFFATARLLIHTNLLKKKVSLYLSRFSNFALYKFVTSYARTHTRTDAQTNFWITIPRVGLKALELIIINLYSNFLTKIN